MPHISLALQNKGDVCACNANKQSYQTDHNTIYTIEQSSIETVWASATRKELINSLDNGQPHPSCQKCWDLEKAGQRSPRQDFNSQFTVKQTESPSVLVIKPGNTCDGACRICNPETSSGWYSDAYQLEKRKHKDLELPVFIQKFENLRNCFSPKNNNFWPVFKKWAGGLEFVDIYGGEPWLIKGLWNTLSDIAEQGHSKNIVLRLHTNLSNYNAKYLDILGKFKKVYLNLSIDSHIKQEFEYQRYPLDFDRCISNAKKYCELTKNLSNIEMRVTCTVSTFNVWNIDQIHRELEKSLGIPVSASNFVTDPDHCYDIRHLPKKIKQELILRLSEYQPTLPVANFLKQTIPSCVIYWPKFVLTTEKLDAVRSQSFHETFPEWSEKLKPYWDYKKPHQEWFR